MGMVTFEDSYSCLVYTLRKYLVLKKGAEAKNKRDNLFLTMDGEKGLGGEWLSKYVRSMMSRMSIGVSVEAHSRRAVSY